MFSLNRKIYFVITESTDKAGMVETTQKAYEPNEVRYCTASRGGITSTVMEGKRATKEKETYVVT
jgi:hypothetical protein